MLLESVTEALADARGSLEATRRSLAMAVGLLAADKLDAEEAAPVFALLDDADSKLREFSTAL